jgi:branched-chain amino acid transport system ATP-binding protein
MGMSKDERENTFFSAEGVIVKFGGLTALNNVNMRVGKNEIRGLIGPNGAGKSTFFNAVTGYIKSAAGDIYFNGEKVSGLGPHQIASRGIIRTFQKRGIFPEMTALENVLVGYHRLMEGVGMWHIGLRMKKFKCLEKEAIQQALETLESVGLHGISNQIAKDLSFGQQTLLEVARVLISKPKLLLLDEPAAGLSSAERDHLGELLKMLVHQKGMSLILSDHIMDFLLEVCEKITVLNFGEVLVEGTTAEIRRDPLVLEAYMGAEHDS